MVYGDGSVYKDIPGEVYMSIDEVTSACFVTFMSIRR